MSEEVKQVIVVRKDLNMRKGKMIAQGSHASMGAVLQLMEREVPFNQYTPMRFNHWDPLKRQRKLVFDRNGAVDLWLNGKFTKICLSVNSEAELIEVYDKAKEKGLNVCLITDAGLTEFNGVPTKTCLAIGPDFTEFIDTVTSNLSLL